MNRYNTKTWRLWTLTPRSFKSREKSHWTCLKCRDTPLICLMIPITRWSHSKGKQVYFIPSLYSLFFLRVASSASFKEPTCASSAYVLINATNSCAYLRLSGTRLLLCNGRLRAPLFRIFRLSVWHRPIWRGAILAPLSSLTVWFTGLSALLELPPSWHSSRFQAAVAAVVDSQKQASPYIRRDQGN